MTLTVLCNQHWARLAAAHTTQNSPLGAFPPFRRGWEHWWDTDSPQQRGGGSPHSATSQSCQPGHRPKRMGVPAGPSCSLCSSFPPRSAEQNKGGPPRFPVPPGPSVYLAKFSRAVLSWGEEERPQGARVGLQKSHTQSEGKESAEKLLLIHLGYRGRVPTLTPLPLYLGCSEHSAGVWFVGSPGGTLLGFGALMEAVGCTDGSICTGLCPGGEGGGEGGGPSALRAHTPHRDAALSAGMGLSRASRGVRWCFSPQPEDAASNLGSGRSSSRKHSTTSFQQTSCRCHLCCCYSRGWGCAWAVLGCSSSGSSSQMLLFRLTCVLSTQGPCGPGGTRGQVQWGMGGCSLGFVGWCLQD